MSLLSSHGCAGADASAPITKSCSTVESTLAEMPQVDHRIGQRFECVVQLAEAIETKKKAAE